MSWDRKKEQKRLCNEWLKDPLVNPETGRAIEKDGPTYNYYKSLCRKLKVANKPVATGKMTWRKCQEWEKNPGINPETGRRLTPGSPTYKKIEKQCKCIQKEKKLLGEYPRPDYKGMVPCKLDLGIYYSLRKHEGRWVYGPQNLYCSKIKNLCYFKDTWDYRYNHYRPIFLGIKEPDRPKISKIDSKEKQDPKYIVDKILDIFL